MQAYSEWRPLVNNFHTWITPFQTGYALSTTRSDATTELYPTDHSREVLYIQEIMKKKKRQIYPVTRKSVNGETDQEKTTRKCKNNQCSQRQLHAQHCREAHEQYEADQHRRDANQEAHHWQRQALNSSVACNLECDFQEVGGQKVYNTPEANVMYAAEV